MQTSGNIEDLVARIKEKARLEAEQIVERAEKVAVRELSKVREDLRVKQAAVEAELDARLAAGREALNAENAIYERRQIMERQEQAIEDVFRLALERLKSEQASDARRGQRILQLTREALDALGVNEAVVKLNESDRELAIRENLFSGLEAAVEVSGETLDAAGGVLVSDKTGRIFYDNSYEARLGRQKPELRARLAEVFGF